LNNILKDRRFGHYKFF